MGFGTRKYLGLELGTDYLTGAEILVRGSHRQVARIGRQSLEFTVFESNSVKDPGMLAETLRHFWRESGFTTRRIALALGGPSLFYRILSLPKLPAAELRRALEWELADHFPFPAQEAVFDFRPLKAGRGLRPGEEYYLVVAAPRALVDGCLTALNLAGLEAWAVEPEPQALLRSWEGVAVAEVSLLLIMRPGYLTLGLAAGGELLFARTLCRGWERFKDMAGWEALARECRSTIGYFQARTGSGSLGPVEIIVYDGGDGEAGEYILRGLEGMFSLPVRMAPAPGRGLTWLFHLPEKMRHSLAACIGSGLREVRKDGRS